MTKYLYLFIMHRSSEIIPLQPLRKRIQLIWTLSAPRSYPVRPRLIIAISSVAQDAERRQAFTIFRIPKCQGAAAFIKIPLANPVELTQSRRIEIVKHLASSLNHIPLFSTFFPQFRARVDAPWRCSVSNQLLN